MHSWPKETHHLGKIPNLHCSQWDLSSFTNFKTWHTLGLFKILGEPFDFFEWVFLRPVSSFCDKIRLCRGHLTLTIGHRGSQWIYGAFLLRPSVVDYKAQYLCTVKVKSEFVTFWSPCKWYNTLGHEHLGCSLVEIGGGVWHTPGKRLGCFCDLEKPLA